MAGDLDVSPVEPANTLEKFVARLVEYTTSGGRIFPNCFGRPGFRRTQLPVHSESEYSEFKIYRARGSDVAACLFLATRNYTFRKDLDARAKPYGPWGGWCRGKAVTRFRSIPMRKH